MTIFISIPVGHRLSGGERSAEYTVRRSDTHQGGGGQSGREEDRLYAG